MSGPDPQADFERRLRNLRAVARHHARRESEPERPPEPGTPVAATAWGKRLLTLGSLGAVLLFLAGKLKLVVPLLKFANLGTLLSMLLAVWVYALYWGLPFALGFVLLIFVHEAGHAVVMKHLGLRAGAPVFIPFVGAVIAMKSLPRDAYVEALVGIGGPVLGSAGALVCLVVGWWTGSLFWYSLASTGFLLNLFNLIPVSPLDGGRIVGVISRWLWAAGYAVGIAVFVATRSPMLLVILLLGLFSLPRVVRGPREGYFAVATGKRLAMGVAYFGLLAALSVGMWAADRPLEALRKGEPARLEQGLVDRAGLEPATFWLRTSYWFLVDDPGRTGRERSRAPRAPQPAGARDSRGSAEARKPPANGLSRRQLLGELASVKSDAFVVDFEDPKRELELV